MSRNVVALASLALISVGDTAAQSAPCGLPPLPACQSGAQAGSAGPVSNKNLGFHCVTNVGACFLGTPTAVGESCQCNTPSGAAHGTVAR